MTRVSPSSPQWPFLLILAALLALCIASPREWEKHARPERWLETAARSAPSEEPAADRAVPASAYITASGDRHPAELDEPPAKQPLPPAPSPVEMTVSVKKPAPLSDSLEPGQRLRTAAGTTDGGAAGMASLAPVAEVSHIEPAERAEVKTKQDLPPEPAQMATLPQLRLDGQKVVLPPTEPAEQPAGKPVLVDSPVEAPAPSAERHWLPEPAELLARLAHLNKIPELAPWARQVQAAIDELVVLESPDAPRAAELLKQLDRLAAQPDDALPTKLSPTSVAELAHARNALARRIDIWQRVPRVSKTIEVVSLSPEKGNRLGRCLDEIDAETSKEVTGSHWREYLLIDALRQLGDRRAQVSDDQRRLLARRVLGRLERSGLSNGQRHFLRTGPLASLRKELYQLSAEPIDSQAMLADLEEFERQQLPSQARSVAQHWDRLRWSAGEGEHELARFVDGHYRNANIRVSISSDLLSKVLPPQSPRTLRVDETILGYPTYGWSTTETKLGVRLIPDPHHLRLALQARGNTFAETDTDGGSVVVHTQTDSAFTAEKEFELSPTGIDARAATVEADSLPKLRWIRSSFDFLPVIRSLVHDAARARHDETKMKAAIETRGKLCSEVRTRLENDVNPLIADFNRRWEKRVAAPLSQLDIEPQIVEATTTAQRLTLRLRMAADDQLAGFAPRPRASADSLASLQVHQSALNNLAERLEWAGRKLSAREMVRVVAQQCDMDATTIIEKLPEDLAVTFASEDPIRVRCQDGRIELTIALASLEKPPQVWRDFEVRVFYKPDPTSTKGLLKRDGVVQLIGDRLGPKAQIALRGIFSKTFPQGRGIQLLADDVDPRFADLQVTQFEIRDGWIGLAVGGTPLPATEVARDTSSAKSR